MIQWKVRTFFSYQGFKSWPHGCWGKILTCSKQKTVKDELMKTRWWFQSGGEKEGIFPPIFFEHFKFGNHNKICPDIL